MIDWRIGRTRMLLPALIYAIAVATAIELALDAQHVARYQLQRVEGVLLRHISGVHKILVQTVPERFKTDPVQEMEAWLAGLLRGIDSSLLDEWERLRNPQDEVSAILQIHLGLERRFPGDPLRNPDTPSGNADRMPAPFRIAVGAPANPRREACARSAPDGIAPAPGW